MIEIKPFSTAPKDGRPFMAIWGYYDQGNRPTVGVFECKWCTLYKEFINDDGETIGTSKAHWGWADIPAPPRDFIGGDHD